MVILHREVWEFTESLPFKLKVTDTAGKSLHDHENTRNGNDCTLNQYYYTYGYTSHNCCPFSIE